MIFHCDGVYILPIHFKWNGVNFSRHWEPDPCDFIDVIQNLLFGSSQIKFVELFTIHNFFQNAFHILNAPKLH